jgi:hypothetical protein
MISVLPIHADRFCPGEPEMDIHCFYFEARCSSTDVLRLSASIARMSTESLFSCEARMFLDVSEAY